MTTALISKDITAVQLFTENGLDPVLDRIKIEIDFFDADPETKKGRESIRSFARKIASSKVFIEKAGKELVSGIKAKSKLIDSERKRSRDTLDKWRDEVRKPLTDYEVALKERLENERFEEERQLEWDDAIKENELIDRQRELDRKEAEIAKAEADRKEKEETERVEKEQAEQEKIKEEQAAKVKEVEAKAETLRLATVKLEADTKALAKKEAGIEAEKKARLDKQKNLNEFNKCHAEAIETHELYLAGIDDEIDSFIADADSRWKAGEKDRKSQLKKNKARAILVKQDKKIIKGKVVYILSLFPEFENLECETEEGNKIVAHMIFGFVGALKEAEESSVELV